MKIQRRINHTGRKRIDKSRIEILLEGETGAKRFTASVNFEHLDLPEDAPVFIEAYQSGRYALQRFECGTVSVFTLPADTYLAVLDSDLPTQFRVKVVDQAGGSGRLLAAAKGIRASNEQPDAEGREELLSVWSREMGDVPWRINFQEDSIPELALNNRIPGATDLIKHNPLFQSMILPAAVRSILSWIYWNELAGEDADEWVMRWLGFAKSIVGEDAPNTAEPAEANRWIEDVVVAFSRKHDMCARLVDHIGKDGK